MCYRYDLRARVLHSSIHFTQSACQASLSQSASQVKLHTQVGDISIDDAINYWNARNESSTLLAVCSLFCNVDLFLRYLHIIYANTSLSCLRWALALERGFRSINSISECNGELFTRQCRLFGGSIKSGWELSGGDTPCNDNNQTLGWHTFMLGASFHLIPAHP